MDDVNTEQDGPVNEEIADDLTVIEEKRQSNGKHGQKSKRRTLMKTKVWVHQVFHMCICITLQCLMKMLVNLFKPVTVEKYAL